jgi:hypothetical protein
VAVADYGAEEGRMLKEDQLAIREVRQLAQKELAPTAAKRDRDEAITAVAIMNQKSRRPSVLQIV